MTAFDGWSSNLISRVVLQSEANPALTGQCVTMTESGRTGPAVG